MNKGFNLQFCLPKFINQTPEAMMQEIIMSPLYSLQNFKLLLTLNLGYKLKLWRITMYEMFNIYYRRLQLHTNKRYLAVVEIAVNVLRPKSMENKWLAKF